MKARMFTVFALVVGLALVLTWAVAAQGPESGPPSSRSSLFTSSASTRDEGNPKAFHSSGSSLGSVIAQDVSPAGTIGEPGLSFRYVRTFGETEVAYFDDPDHLSGPIGLGTDGTNVWIVEEAGRRALKYASDGTFLMQIGKAGFRDVAGTTFHILADVAVDGSGNIWVVDQDASHVVKFDSSGNRLSELGVTWNPGTGNDRFNQPYSIAFDTAGNIYISDGGNHRIQVFNSDGSYLTTIGESGVPGSDNAHFNRPRHIAVDSNNLFYIADGDNHRVQIFDVSASPVITYVATLGVTGESSSDNAHFNTPEGVAVDVARGRIYVADGNNHRVQVFDYTTRAYQTTLGGFSYTSDVAMDAEGNLYEAETWSSASRVQQFDSDLNYVRTYGTTGVPYLTDGSHYNRSEGVAVAPDGSIYISEHYGHRLVKLNAAGVPQWIIGEAGHCGSENDRLCGPRDVTLDAAGRVYVVDSWNNRVQIYNPDGSYYATLGTGYGSSDYQFESPTGLAIAPNGDIYVADPNNQRVQVFNSDRVYIATLGETGVAGSDNAHFKYPRDVEVDSAGNIYVVDTDNHRVQIFDSNRAYVRTLGQTGVAGNDFEHLDSPVAVTVDAAGRIYVADQWGVRVQVFDSSGAYLTTIGGIWGGRTGQLRNAADLAIDATGNLYMADNENHRIQKFAPGVPGWVQSNINGFGHPSNPGVLTLTPFKGYLYAGIDNRSDGKRLWRASDGKTWTAVITESFGLPYNHGVDHLIEFNDQLYAGTKNWNWNVWNTEGGEVWRSSDGLSWTRVVRQGFGDPTNGEIFRLAVFSDTLYASTWSYTEAHGAEIWRSRTGIAGDWTRMITNGFGDANNEAVPSFELFNGYLYAGTYNWTTGGEVWHTSDGTNWGQVNLDGLGDADNYGVTALVAFEGYLYAGTGHKSGAGAQVWRCQVCDGSDWQQVVDNGFGNSDTRSTPALEVFDGSLYVIVGNQETGLEVWRTQNGVDWQQVGFAGFGDSNNATPILDNSVTVFDNRLYIGTWNTANGGEVWQKSVVTADFTASPTEGVPPLTVTFTNTSTGDYTSSLWDFGDDITSTLTSPTHVYTVAGVYTVTLAVSDGIDTSTITRSNYITVRYSVYLPLILRNY